ncbi:hypothetical protein ACGF5M_05965, partial [Gemmatimonadota bacterium]
GRGSISKTSRAEVAVRVGRIVDGARLFYIRDTFLQGYVDLPAGIPIDVVNVRELNSTVLRFPPDVFVCFGHRLPDIYWTYWFKKRGAQTAQVQHGLYTDFFPKSVGGFVSSPRRKLRYLRYLGAIITSPIRERLRTGVSILRKDFVFRRLEPRIAEEMMSDRIFVWGEYWKEWYKTSLFYKSDRVEYTVCGSFDSLSLQDPLELLQDDAGVAYVCQTLVEDGRMKPRMFARFLDRLSAFVEREESIRLYLRLHPRTDLRLYSRLLAHPRIEATRQFPYVPRYLGHYSSLLSSCFRPDADVVLVHFPGLGHHVPEHLSRLATAHRSYLDALDLSAFEGGGRSQEGQFDPSYYWEAVEDPFTIIAEGLVAMASASNR